MKRAVWALLFWLGVALPGSPVLAHEVRPAYLEISESSPGYFNVLWKQPSSGPLVLRLQPELSNGLLNAAASEEYTASNFTIRRWTGVRLERNTFDGATVRIAGLEHTMTDALVVISFAGGQQIQTLLRPDSASYVIHLAGTGKIPVRGYLELGIEHILTGFDHLSFVLCLVMLVRYRSRLVQTITAFTVGHSISLAAAVFGYVKFSAPLIEALVALSIVFIAVELRKTQQGQEGLTSRYPWLIAFTFGLLHGLAFASSLADVGLPAQHIPTALLLFNIGVEVGQLLFVGLVLGLIGLLRWLKWERHVSPWRWLVSYGIGSLAAYWMLERLNPFFQ